MIPAPKGRNLLHKSSKGDQLDQQLPMSHVPLRSLSPYRASQASYVLEQTIVDTGFLSRSRRGGAETYSKVLKGSTLQLLLGRIQSPPGSGGDGLGSATPELEFASQLAEATEQPAYEILLGLGL
jgi:hypothetical protein